MTENNTVNTASVKLIMEVFVGPRYSIPFRKDDMAITVETSASPAIGNQADAVKEKLNPPEKVPSTKVPIVENNAI